LPRNCPSNFLGTESNCGAGGTNLVRNISLVGSNLNLCPGTDGGGNHQP